MITITMLVVVTLLSALSASALFEVHERTVSTVNPSAGGEYYHVMKRVFNGKVANVIQIALVANLLALNIGCPPLLLRVSPALQRSDRGVSDCRLAFPGYFHKGRPQDELCAHLVLTGLRTGGCTQPWSPLLLW